jgi:hypothetical protein
MIINIVFYLLKIVIFQFAALNNQRVITIIITPYSTSQGSPRIITKKNIDVSTSGTSLEATILHAELKGWV